MSTGIIPRPSNWETVELDNGTYGVLSLLVNRASKVAIAYWQGNSTTPPANTKVTASISPFVAALGGVSNVIRNGQYMALRDSAGAVSTDYVTVYLNNVNWSGGEVVFGII